MITAVKKVYQCEHCKKNMLSAGAMSRHEKYCRLNPNNLHKCFDLCRNLTRRRILINGKDPFNSGSYQTVLECKKLNVKMYSYLLEKKSTAYFGSPVNFEGLMRMPLQCIHYEYMTESEIEERFNINL